MKNTLLTIYLLIAGSWLVTGECYGTEINASSYSQTRVGMIQAVDRAARTAVISGYRYSFSGVKGYDHPDVRMYGSNFGSFMLLNVGMTVKVVYRLSEKSRIVVELQQVADGARLGVPHDVG